MLSALNRRERLAALETTLFDVLVVGGGITGAAVALDAAARGLFVALVEQDDWASGTSSRSSKLIHGGLRYLATGNLELVFESLSERALLTWAAPHLVEPGDFLFPVYRDRGVSRWLLEAGLTAYDLLSLGHSRRHRRLTRGETLRRERALESGDLLGSCVYSDARTDDARLTLENVLDASDLGAVAVSRLRVEGLSGGRGERHREAYLRDRESGRTLVARARVVVNASGPWTDAVRKLDDGQAQPELRLSRGAHLSVRSARLPVAETIAFPIEDGRLLFAIPFGPVTLVGTTDTDHNGDAADVAATAAEVDYLLAAARKTFPAAALARSDVLSTFAGVRPLVRQKGRSLHRTSREDSIEVAATGLVTVAGGKLTTHRRSAEKAVDRVARQLRRLGVEVSRGRARHRPLPGKPASAMPELFSALEKLSGPADSPTRESIHHLGRRYGSRAFDVLGLAVSDRALGRRVSPGLPDLDAEVVFAARCEDARSVADVLIRRTHLFWQDGRQGLDAAERIADLLGQELGWDRARKRASLEDYAREVARSRAWSLE